MPVIQRALSPLPPIGVSTQDRGSQIGRGDHGQDHQPNPKRIRLRGVQRILYCAIPC